MMRTVLTSVYVFFVFFWSTAQPVSGVKTVGPSGDFNSLTEAFGFITGNGLAGPLELQLISGYSSVTETFPLIPPANATATRTITIYPVASGLSITSSSANGTIDLNQSKYVIFDGRVNAAGTIGDLLISNTNPAAFSIRFIQDASHNIFRYCSIKGVNTTAGLGTVTFAEGIMTGNDDNEFAYCTISDGASLPLCSIFSRGAVTSTTISNSSNKIDHCNISNFFADTGTTSAICLDEGNGEWEVTANSFFQTSPRNPAGDVDLAFLRIRSGAGHTISGNYLGGAEPLAAGGAWVFSGGGTPPVRNHHLTGIEVTDGVDMNEMIYIHNNFITNIQLSSNPAGNEDQLFTGIRVKGGRVSISGNTIGAATGNGAILVTLGNAVASSAVRGIDFRIAAGSISNNSIGGITVSGGSSAGAHIQGIYAGSEWLNDTLAIEQNLMGSLTTTASIRYSSTSYPCFMTGLFLQPEGGSGKIVCLNNTVANLTNSSTQVSSYLMGLRNAGFTNGTLIQGNQIRNLSAATTNATPVGFTALTGIYSSSPARSLVIDQNHIHSLHSTATSGNIMINGIYVTGSNGEISCCRNYIHHFSLVTSGSSAGCNGICINASGNLGTYCNNMIHLGIKPDGNNLTGNYSLNGIYVMSGINEIIFNSIHIGGSVTSGSLKTYACQSLVTGNSRIFRNNIFSNQRTGGTGKHYAIKISGTGLNPAGLSSDHNIYWTTGSVLGYYNADITSLAALRSATGQDVHSIQADPRFVNSAGNPSTTDLHISSTFASPAESQGMEIAGFDEDFDGQSRLALTPTDIGADAGNFILLDVSGPVILVNAICNTTSLLERTLPGLATITDPSGINFMTGTAPRIYFKKSTDANTYAGNTSSNNGWKWNETDSAGSPVDFLIDYSLLYNSGGGAGFVVPGDQIQYFIVAQDDNATPLVGISSGVFASTPSSVALTTAAFPLAGIIRNYYISAGLSGIIPVGSGQTISTLTGVLGLFDQINQNVVTGDVTVRIVSDLTENGQVSLLQWVEVGAGGYSLTIEPEGLITRTISGTLVPAFSPMIHIQGADRVTINGIDRHLVFRNTRSNAAINGPAIQFSQGCENCTTTQCILESNGTSLQRGTLTIGDGSNAVTISHNQIRDAITGTQGIPAVALLSGNSDNTLFIHDNELFNFMTYGILLKNAGSDCQIMNNHFYFNHPVVPGYGQTCIGIYGGDSHLVSGNFLGGQSPFCGGNAWSNQGAVVWRGIDASFSTGGTSEISGNTIRNISLTSTGNAYFNGIRVSSGSADIGSGGGNTIGHTVVTGGITLSGTGSAWGIIASAESVIANNTVSNIFNTHPSNPGNVIGLRISGDFPVTAEKNLIKQIGASYPSAGGTPNYPSAGILLKGDAAGMTNTYLIRNNLISLGEDITNDMGFIGIWDYGPGTRSEVYYNSILISGTGTGSHGDCAGFLKQRWSVVILKNDIFSSSRTGGSGAYSLKLLQAGELNSDYHDLHVVNPLQPVFWLTGPLSLMAWQNLGQDQHSIAEDPQFIPSGNLLPQDGSPVIGAGIPLHGIVDDDYTGIPRSLYTPTMGAYELVTDRELNLSLFLDGLWTGTGMREAQDENGPHWGAGIADKIQVALHAGSYPYEEIWSIQGVDVSTAGVTQLLMPVIHDQSYYIVIRHRNSIQTWSVAPVSFAMPSVTFDFTDDAGKAFGQNQQFLAPGIYGLYAGDVNQDEVIDSNDLGEVDNDSNQFMMGYLVTDINGDGIIDSNDMGIVDNHANAFIMVLRP